jgi:hypothetical protein
MMYFRPDNLSELRVISRMLNIAMVDFVGAAMEAYIHKREAELGRPVPQRSRKRYVGPRNDTSERRVRYVMRLDRDLVEKIRDIACLDNRRFTHVCDDAVSSFISFTKAARNFNNIWTARSDVEAVRGRKSFRSIEEIDSLLELYKKMPTASRG